MSFIQSFRDLAEKIERPLGIQPSFLPQQLSQVRPFDVLHRQIEVTVFFAGADSRDDVRMVEAGRQLGFP